MTLILELMVLLAAIALMRVGMRHFWTAPERPAPRLRVVECVPIGLLLLACAGLVMQGEPVLDYLRDTADTLHRPERYIDAVLATRPVANTTAGRP